MQPASTSELRLRLKQLIIEVADLDDLTPADIDDDARLVGGDLPLDSLDTVEIAAAIDYEFGVRIEDLSVAKAAFRSVASLAEYIAKSQAG